MNRRSWLDVSYDVGRRRNLRNLRMWAVWKLIFEVNEPVENDGKRKKKHSVWSLCVCVFFYCFLSATVRVWNRNDDNAMWHIISPYFVVCCALLLLDLLNYYEKCSLALFYYTLRHSSVCMCASTWKLDGCCAFFLAALLSVISFAGKRCDLSKPHLVCTALVG